MRTFALTLCLIFSPVGAFAQPNDLDDLAKELREKERHRPRLNYSGNDWPQIRTPPSMQYSNDGIRSFRDREEARMVQEKERIEKQKREESMRAFSEQQRANAEKRSSDAQWKLGAIILGVFIGILRAIWSACSART